MANMDWQASLQQFLDNNPDLEKGDTPAEATEEEKSSQKKPRLDIILDKKGRNGKTATLIVGFGEEYDDRQISDLAAMIKQKLGTGGSARGGEILIQGDRRKDVDSLLKSHGYKTRII